MPKLLSFLFLLYISQCAKRIQLPSLEKQQLLDQSQLVHLAEQEKFTIPLTGRTISHEIEYMPKNQGQCEYVEPTITYKSLAQTQAGFGSEGQIQSILTLKTREIVFVGDPYFNIASFSIDRHFLLKQKLPKTSLYSQQSKQTLSNPALVATSNEQYIYYLTPTASFIFHYINIASDIKQFQLQGNPSTISKAIQQNGFILLCGLSGVFVYRIQEDRTLKLVQKVQALQGDFPVDMQLNWESQLLYVLNSQNTISIFLFDPRPPKADAQVPLKILTEHDKISLQNITRNHAQNSNIYELIGNVNIEISRGRSEQTIMVLFTHSEKTVIAEINYHSLQKEFSFIRYFKYSVEVKEIHVINEVMVVVGSGILGMFPYGIDARLIVEQFNGFMTLTPIQKIAIIEAPFFVGVSKTDIQYGGILLNNEAGINCHLGSSSNLKELKFRANLTRCSQQTPISSYKYCEYEKTFIIKQMQLTASAPVATSLWIATIVFTGLVVVGLCCVFTIQKRKQNEIRKLELYFEERKRSEVPAESDRNQQEIQS